MPEQDSIPSDDRLALSVLLTAGADPERLARWYADNSDHSPSHIATTIDAMTSAGVLRPVTHPDPGRQCLQPRGATQS